MTRFWITLEAAVEFVLSSMELVQGGETFVPKIPSMRIVDLAQALAPDAELDIVGIRPGEKLHEVLLTEDEARQSFDLGDRYAIMPSRPTGDVHAPERGDTAGGRLPLRLRQQRRVARRRAAAGDDRQPSRPRGAPATAATAATAWRSQA